MAQTVAVTLSRQIISVLSSVTAVWQRCVGPNGLGITLEELLSLLQEAFPDAAWDLTAVRKWTTVGTKAGWLKQYPTDVWYLNADMIAANAANAKLASASPYVRVPRCSCGATCGQTLSV